MARLPQDQQNLMNQGGNAFGMLQGNFRAPTNNAFSGMMGGVGARGVQPQGLSAGQPQPVPGLGLAGPAPLANALNAGRFACGVGLGNQPAQQPSSYNPSGEILAMINNGKGLSLPSQGKGIGIGGGLPQGIGQPQGLGQMPPQPPLGLGSMPTQPELGTSVQGSGFDLTDFPSLGSRSSNAPGLQQFRTPGHPAPHATAQSEFAILSEDFPALPGAPASASGSSAGGSGGLGPGGGGGGGVNIFRASSIDHVDAVLSAKDRGDDGRGMQLGGAAGSRTDRYGLMGILSVIRMTDQDLNTLALGTDLTTLGLNLNSSECLYATFASPWADAPAQRDPEFNLPQCYYMQPPALKTGHFSKFQLETLFYIFYNMPRDTLQAYAATELYNRDWRYHKDLTLWFTRASRQGTDDNPKGQYIYFDINEWKKKMFHGAGHVAANITPEMEPPSPAPDEQIQ